jgi:hypothetical protein
MSATRMPKPYVVDVYMHAASKIRQIFNLLASSETVHCVSYICHYHKHIFQAYPASAPNRGRYSKEQ